MSAGQSMSAWEQVYDLIMAGWTSQAVRAMAALSIAEHLGDGPLSAEEIARRERCDTAAMYRLLRAGTSVGLVSYDPSAGTFAATERLAILDGRSPNSLKNYAQAAIGPAFWLPALNLTAAVRSGASQARASLGADVFEWFGQHPEAAAQFGAAMTDLSTPIIREAVAHITPPSHGVAVDVGGAEGAFLAALLQAAPQLTGIVLELDHALGAVGAVAESHGVEGRMTGMAGDFLASVPEGDLFLLKFVLHDCDDATASTILGNIRAAMRPQARLYIVEMAAAADSVPPGLAAMDMAMLFSFAGHERELDHFARLIDAAGLAVVSTVALTSPYHLIEVRCRV